MSRVSNLQWSEEDKLRIFKVFEKTEADVQEDIEIIKTWLSKQPHLPEIPDDAFIRRFLILNKFRIEITKQKIDNYYTMRGKVPELLAKLPTSPEMVNVALHFTPMPKLADELYRLVIIKMKNVEDNNFDPVTFFAYGCNVLELRIREDMYLRDIQIYDFMGLKISDVAKITPLLMKKVITIMEKVYSNPFHALHLVNVPGFLDNFVTLFKSFMKKKLANRVFTHRGIDTIYDVLPKHILPKDYGGDEKSLDELTDEWKKLFLQKEQCFKSFQALRVNENLRPGKSTLDDFYGAEGNFKKLIID